MRARFSDSAPLFLTIMTGWCEMFGTPTIHWMRVNQYSVIFITAGFVCHSSAPKAEESKEKDAEATQAATPSQGKGGKKGSPPPPPKGKGATPVLVLASCQLTATRQRYKVLMPLCDGSCQGSTNDDAEAPTPPGKGEAGDKPQGKGPFMKGKGTAPAPPGANKGAPPKGKGKGAGKAAAGAAESAKPQIVPAAPMKPIWYCTQSS
eukprot:1796292-Amphidinium_carterae.1